MESLITDTSTSTHPVIGVFPNNWEFSRFGREFERSNERNGDSPIGPMLSVSEYRGIEVRTNFRDGQLPSEDVAHYRVVRPGQLVANLMWLDHGGLGVSHFPGYVSPAYMAFNISERVYPAFAHHVLRSSVYVDSYKRLGRGVRPNSQMVDSVDLRQLPFPLPPFETQQRIADYLDRETAEIDDAVADLDKYLELLEKRRLETITSAVEGSSGPGKDKLGSEEFFKPKLGYVVIDIRTGLNPRKNFELDTPGAENWYVTVRELDGVSIRTSEATSKINDQALEMIQKRARIKVGDVLFSGTGTIGNTALVSLPPSNWGVKEGIYILTPDISLMRSDFLLWILRSRKILSLADEMSDGSTIKSIPIEKLKRVPIPLPSLSMQKLIVNYLDRETTEIDVLVTESKKLRGLLLKRRSVLITEVVTGRKQV